MYRLLTICLLIFLTGNQPDYPLKNGRPTSKGIEKYIDEQGNSILEEFKDFINDTIYNVWIYVENLHDYEEDNVFQLGKYFLNEVYINKAEFFEAYELGDLTARQKDSIGESNRFVKAVVIHELTHEYVHQIRIEMRSIDHVSVHRSYQSGLSIVISSETFGSLFIEEGLCEYVTEKMGELIPPDNLFIPKSVDDIISRENLYQVKYKYSSAFLKPFLDTTGLKAGIKILLHNPPPTYEEIMHPDLFFSRLVSIDN